MGKGNKSEDESSCQKYGVPLYGAAWVPPAAAVKEDSAAESETPASDTVNRHVVLAGGGGEGHSGIPNAILLSAFDFESNSLSDQPVAKHGTASDLPYRIAVHPGGEGVICSFPKSCRWFEWGVSTDKRTLSLKRSAKVLEQLEDVGQQLAMTFNDDGSLLAVGGEGGGEAVLPLPEQKYVLNFKVTGEIR
ncbi:UNVERIFIED_CONTAM: SEC12-like protein 2 [Sesamum calycinum]|uniref:SEC12-like protein 2 n=1 Tax=Sesamum calycinum TaxID=2727403 RepID=A0AAW2QZ16_9LAMI